MKIGNISKVLGSIDTGCQCCNIPLKYLTLIARRKKTIEAMELGEGIYTAVDAAKILGIKYQQADYWFRNYARKALEQSTGHKYYHFNGKTYSVNFLTLIEMYVFYVLKEHQMSPRKIIEAHSSIGVLFKTPYPFAHKNLIVTNRDIFFEHMGDYIKADGTLQYAIEKVIVPFCKKIDYNSNEIAERLFPLGKSKGVVVDPGHQFGSPTILGTNILVDSVLGLYSAGESMEFIANLYEIPTSSVRDAIKFAKAA